MPPGSSPRPGARQALEELAGEVRAALRRLAGQRPAGSRPRPAVRDFEMKGKHVKFRCCSDEVGQAKPRPEWLAYRKYHPFFVNDAYGVSVFRDEVWLWVQSDKTYVVAVRRDATDREVIDAALASDGAALDLLGKYAHAFNRLIDEHRGEIVDRGYEDVVRKAKAILVAVELLVTDRSEEEEGVPA